MISWTSAPASRLASWRAKLPLSRRDQRERVSDRPVRVSCRIPVAAAVAATLCALAALAQQPARPAGSVAERFHQLDRNGDGKVSAAEFPNPLFQQMDRDGDRFITPEEVRAFYAGRPAGGLAGAPAKPAGQEAVGPQPGEEAWPGGPRLRAMPTGDAATDAAGRGQLFESIVIEGFTDIVEGTNGIALADLNHDGLVDIIATYTTPNNWRDAEGNSLRVFLNQGDLRFQLHPITIRNSELTGESFGLSPQIPNLVDFNGDGLLDIFITRSAPMLAGKPVAGMTPLGNTLLLSDGAWDTFRDVSAQLGARNETGYNRQSSFGDVNKDGWLDIAVGCDNIGNAMGGVPHSRLYVFKPKGAKFEDGHFEDIGGSDLVPDFGGFYHDSAKDKAGPGITLRDLDNDGDLDLVQSFHCDVRQPLLPYSPGEYRQGVFCWKNLLAETGQLRFEKVTGNGLACEARLRYDRDRQLYEPVGKAPGLPYLFFADVDNDGLQDVLAIGPSDPGWAPRAEDVGGRFWKNLGGIKFQEDMAAAGLEALNWSYRQWYRFFDVSIPPAAENWKPRRDTYFYSQPGLKQRHPLDERFYFANAIFGDFDNDGWLDLVVLDRHEAPTRPSYRVALFMNRDDGTFELKPTTFSGLDSTGISGEAADLNNDGLLDLVFAADPDNSGGGRAKVPPDRYQDKVYWNTGRHGARENHWLRLRFSGVSAAELIGARVAVYPPSTSDPRPVTAKPLATRAIASNHSYKSGGALEAHFGLGKHERVDVAVTLLSGRQVGFAGVTADRFLDLDLKTAATVGVETPK